MNGVVAVRQDVTARATPVRARLLGPDLARGGMLLLIALANVDVFAFGFLPGFRGYPVEQSVLDSVFTVVRMVLVDGRAFPLFAALFGYGLTQLLQNRGSVRAGRSTWLLRRRGIWLVAIGFVHGMLLFTADIVALYGLCALLFAGLVVRLSDRGLLAVALSLTALALLSGALRGLPAEALGQAEVVTATPTIFGGEALGALQARVGEWAVGAIRLFGLMPAVLFGVYAGRRSVLTWGPERKRVLGLVAVAGLAVGILAGVPSALMAASIWTDPALGISAVAGTLHLAGGYAAAAGYLALFALLAAAVRQPPGPLVKALSVSGQRSLTLYLSQSLLFLVLFDPDFFGLGDNFGIAVNSAVAVGVWVVGVLSALLMDRLSVRGPAEVLLRRLTYRPPARSAGPRPRRGPDRPGPTPRSGVSRRV